MYALLRATPRLEAEAVDIRNSEFSPHDGRLHNLAASRHRVHCRRLIIITCRYNSPVKWKLPCACITDSFLLQSRAAGLSCQHVSDHTHRHNASDAYYASLWIQEAVKKDRWDCRRKEYCQRLPAALPHLGTSRLRSVSASGVARLERCVYSSVSTCSNFNFLRRLW